MTRKETKKLKLKFDLTFILKLITVILLIIAFSLVMVVIVRGKKVSTNSDIVNNLYSYMGSNDLLLCSGIPTYDSKKTTYDSIKNDVKICNAYTKVKEDNITTIKIDKSKKENICSIGKNVKFATDNYEDNICTVTKISADKIGDEYFKIYGKTIEQYETFDKDNKTICYFEDGFYYCGLSETYTYTIGAEPHTFRSLKNALKKKDNIIIYDYFVKVINNECYTSFKGDVKNSKCSENYKSEEKTNYAFLKKYGTLYKHIFKLNESNDTYYWVSSEPVL
ncbi:MAG: hypothetical protein RSF02_01745 [Bacilli bacterium]